MSDFRVSSEAIRNVAGQVASGAEEIDAQRQTLLSQIHGLGDSWQGSAATALQTLYEKWDSDVRTLQTTLTEIGQTMQEAATNYETTETGVQRSFT